VIAAVVTPQGVWSGAAGVDGPDGRLAAPQDVFAIASISKMFTAAILMRLADEGKIDLDKPLSEYLGDVGSDANGATVREALGMRSGIPDTADASRAKLVAAPERVWTAAEVVAEFPKPVAKAGVEYNYSNPTYKLLGLAAEHVTGAGLSEAIRSEVLDPAGLPATPLVQGADTSTPKPWALPTQPGDLEVAEYGTGGALPSVAIATFALAASGMASDAPSLASWAWQLFAGKIVSAQSLTAMTTIGQGGYGLGVEAIGGVGPPPVFGHGGSLDGYESLLAVIPDRQLVIVVFVNRRDADVSSIAADLVDVVKA
jgi:D-alanyl-D-alanine carboxypeptidase